MIIATIACGLVAVVVACQSAKAGLHRDRVARECWMVRNSIQRAGE